MDRNTFIEKVLKVKESILNVGGEIYSFDIGEPVSQELIRELESLYCLKFPVDFVDMCTLVAGRVDISWSLYHDKGRALNRRLSFSQKAYPIFGGELRWNIEAYFSEYKQKIHGNPCNNPELVGKLHLFDVPNGAMVMFDISNPSVEKPVVYLGHDDCTEGPQQLAPSFKDYVFSLLDIGLVGSEMEQMGYFINQTRGGIDLDLPATQEWRKTIGLA